MDIQEVITEQQNITKNLQMNKLLAAKKQRECLERVI